MSVISPRVVVSPTLLWVTPEVAVPGGCLGVCPSTPSSARYTIPQRGLLPVAPSQPVMSVLKTPEHFSKRWEPVSICPVTAVSRRAPRARQDGSAQPGSWPQLTTSLGLGWAIHLPWKAQGVVECRGAGGVVTPCWPGQAGGRVDPTLGRVVELSVPVLLPGLQPWPGRSRGMDRELGWWKGSGKGFRGCGCCRAGGDLPLVLRLGDEGSQTSPSSLSPQGAIYHLLIPMFIKTKSPRDQMHHFLQLWLFRNDHSMLGPHCVGPFPGDPMLLAEIVRLENGNFWIWEASPKCTP